MGWWSNVVATYKYQKALKEHQKICKAQQDGLDKAIRENRSSQLQADLARNIYMQEHSGKIPPAPTPPDPISKVGRFFGGNATLSDAENTNYGNTQTAFREFATNQDFHKREHSRMAQQLAEGKAAGKVYAVAATESGEIVPGAAQQIRDNPTATNPGMASKHYTLPYDEAQAVANNANGFLYVKKSADEMTGELRATLPKTITVPDRSSNAKKGATVTIPLREGYNRFIRALSRASFDADGNVTLDAPWLMDKFTEVANSSVLYGWSVKQREDEYRKLIETHFGPTMSDEGNMLVEHQVDMIAKCLVHSGHPVSALVNPEGAGAWSDAMNGIIGAQAHPAEKRLETIEQELAAMHGKDSPEYQRAMARSEEIIPQLYKQVDETQKAIQDLRELDVHGQEVPLINACSANAAMITNLTALAAPGQTLGVSKFDNLTHWEEEAYAPEALQYLKDLPAATPEEKTAEMKALAELENRLTHGDPKASDKLATAKADPNSPVAKGTQKDEDAYVARLHETAKQGARSDIRKKIKDHLKYEYHQAGIVGRTDTQGITIETFAAETSQLSVPPFTCDSAVGVYSTSAADQGSTVLSGMKQYYDMDKSLPDAPTKEVIAHNSRLVRMLREMGGELADPENRAATDEEKKAMIDGCMQRDHQRAYPAPKAPKAPAVSPEPTVAPKEPTVTQEEPKVEQEAPKVTQEAPKVEQEAPKVTQEAPKVEQEAPKVEQVVKISLDVLERTVKGTQVEQNALANKSRENKEPKKTKSASQGPAVKS